MAEANERIVTRSLQMSLEQDGDARLRRLHIRRSKRMTRTTSTELSHFLLANWKPGIYPTTFDVTNATIPRTRDESHQANKNTEKPRRQTPVETNKWYVRESPRNMNEKKCS
jgi:hypothetical protein